MNDTPQIKWKDFVPWLRRQPRERQFDYQNTDHCMICEFVKETQGFTPSVGGFQWRPVDTADYQDIPNLG